MSRRNVGGIVAVSAVSLFLVLGAAVAPMALTSATTAAIAAATATATPCTAGRQAVGSSPYVNPFTVGQWAPARTDQGVDWLPLVPSPVLAIGDGVVTYSATTGTGWPGGAFLTYRLTDGPAAGSFIYVAEHLGDLVPTGTTVTAGQQLATALPNYPWTEWGWAAPTGPSPAVPYHGAADGTATAGGKAFARFLESLDVKPLDDPGPGSILPDGALVCDGSRSATPTTPTDFANRVLAGLGIAANGGNVPALIAWAMAEGGWSHDNPLNTTLPEPGATDLPGNPAHVKVYPTLDLAVEATVSVLGEPAYATVVTALRGTDPWAVARAVAASPWGTADFSAEIGVPYNP